MKKLLSIILAITIILSTQSTMLASASTNEYNVVNYGAKGNDKNDDTAAIQQALSINRHVNVNDTSKAIVVYIPAGTYYINTHLSIFSNTTLRLHKDAKIVRTNPNAQMLLGRGVNFANSPGGYNQIKNITVEGGTWDGNTSAGSDYMGLILLRHGSNITVRNTTLRNCSEHFLNVSASQNVLIEGVTFRDAIKYTGSKKSEFLMGAPEQNRYSHIEAIHLDSATKEGEPNMLPLDGTPCKDVTVRNCTFDKVYSGVGNHHVTSKKTTNILIENNTFKNIFFACVLGFGFENLTVKNNTATDVNTFIDAYASTGEISNNKVSGNFKNFLSGVSPRDSSRIQIYAGSNFTISGNNVSNGTRSGIEVGTGVGEKKGSTATVKNNTISNTGTRGIQIADNSTVTATDNTITNVGERGIFVFNAKNSTIEKNKVTGSGKGGMFIENSEAIKVINNIFSSSKEFGIATKTSKNITITDNTISGSSAKRGIQIADNSADVKAINNTITNMSERGIFILNSKNTTIERNRVTGGGKDGMFIENSDTVNVTNNTFSNNKDRGIATKTAKKVTITDNVVTGNSGSWDISVYDNSTGTISSNFTDDKRINIQAGSSFTKTNNNKTQTFTVKYNSNGGTGSMANTTVTFGKSTALRANSFKRTGSTFTGWNAHRSSDNKWLYYSSSLKKDGWYAKGKQPSGYSLQVYKNQQSIARTSSTNKDVVTMHAVWNTNKFTINYNSNGGTGSMANTTVTFGKSTALRANSFKRTGSTFVGWNAHRKSDNKWLYYSSSLKKDGWYAKGKQPSGYSLQVYKNQQSLARTSSVNNDIITMHAIWK